MTTINTANISMKIVSVLVPMPAAQGFSYFVPDTLPNSENLTVGSIVQVPLGHRLVAGLIAEIDAKTNIEAKKLRAIVKIFDCPPLSPALMRFIHFVADYTLSPPGMVARMVLRVPTAFDPEASIQGLRYTGGIPDRLTPARQKIIEIAKNGQDYTASGLAHAAGTSTSVVEGLKAQGFFSEIALLPPPITPLPNAFYARPILENSQQQAAQQLTAALEQKKYQTLLLDGVTGAGKTEVYFEAVAKAFANGQQVLILLPEIALTQQFLDRFQARFAAPPAQWHSDITPKQREKIWRQSLEGRIQIVAGARSALFLPFKNLGLIIVDEEHDSAYKQEDRVFYNARDMAVARGAFENIPVILSSATPSIESLVNCQQKRYQAVHLTARYKEAALPNLRAIDMRKFPPKNGRFISNILENAMAETLEKGEQSLIFLNRRGYAPLTLCRVCGHRFQCHNCSSWLVEHRFRKQLMCHHCGYHEPTPEACPECGTLDHLVACGPGVERIAEEVQNIFKTARILILSTDLIAGVKQLRLELETISKGEVDIIIGTQLVAKGHHFPHISLVGVIDADIGLANGDPRAAERTFQLLSQVTGRAGRTGLKSQGLIQTYQPEHPVMQAIILGDKQAFYAREIEERARHHLPPFGKLAAIIISSENRNHAESHAKTLRKAAPYDRDISVLGPAEAPLAFIRGRYRFRLLLHGQKQARMQHYIKALLHNAAKSPANIPKNIHVQIDIDPQSFL